MGQITLRRIRYTLPMKHFAAAIFDMDGLLLDTERVALGAFEDACRQLDLTLPNEVFIRCIGLNKRASCHILEEALAGRVELQRFWDMWDGAYHARVACEPVRIKEGAVSLLTHLGTLGVPAAVATSTSTARAESKLQTAGLLDHFKAVIGGDQVTRSKPYPDIYLRAAGRLGVDPAACLALEDSENGVRAAVASGMCVVQIPDLVPPSPQLRSLGHIVLPGLAEVVSYPFPRAAGEAVTLALEQADQPEVIALIEALDAYQKPLYPLESFHGCDLAELLKPSVIFAVARHQGKAVGCGAVLLGSAHGEIKRLYVHPGHRGRRIGVRLLAFLEEVAAARGCRRFVLETGIHQHEALALYRRAGYEAGPPFDDYLPDPLSVFMFKDRP